MIDIGLLQYLVVEERMVKVLGSVRSKVSTISLDVREPGEFNGSTPV